jgi:hypothetical protein
MPQNTDLVTDLPADFEVFGQAVATSMADLLGGASGYILSKNSATDMDFVWIANDQGDITGITATAPLTGGGSSGAVTVGIQDALTTQKGAVQLSDSTSTTSSILAATPTAVKAAYDLADGAIAKTTVTTAGDIIYRNATVPVRLGIGTANQVLTVNAGATAPEWKTPSAGAFSGVHLSKSTNQSCANNATTTITFDTEQFDTDAYHANSPNPSRITVTTAGYYSVYGQIILDNNTNGVRQAWIAKNGSNYTMLNYNGVAGTSYAPSTLSGSDIIYLAASDYIEIQLSQSSGGALNALGDGSFGGSFGCRFTMQKLGA